MRRRLGTRARRPCPAAARRPSRRAPGAPSTPSSSHSRRWPSPSSTTKISSSSGVAVRRRVQLAREGPRRGGCPVRAEPAARPRSRTRRPTVAPSRSTGLEVGDVDDGRRARRQLADLGRAGRGLARPRVILLGADRRPGLAEPRDAGARQPRDAVRERALPEREHVEPVGPGLQRVRVLEREVDEAVAGAHLVADGIALALPLHGDARAAEHVEDLLLGALEMERRRPHAGVDLDPLHADRAATRGR